MVGISAIADANSSESNTTETPTRCAAAHKKQDIVRKEILRADCQYRWFLQRMPHFASAEHTLGEYYSCSCSTIPRQTLATGAGREVKHVRLRCDPTFRESCFLCIVALSLSLSFLLLRTLSPFHHVLCSILKIGHG